MRVPKNEHVSLFLGLPIADYPWYVYGISLSPYYSGRDRDCAGRRTVDERGRETKLK